MKFRIYGVKSWNTVCSKEMRRSLALLSISSYVHTSMYIRDEEASCQTKRDDSKKESVTKVYEHLR